MNVALGFKAHSGWAALVVLGDQGGELQVVDRRRVELVEAGDTGWAKHPYHAAEELDRDEARKLVRRSIAMARRTAVRELRAAVKRAEAADHRVVACAVLVGEGMPDWTVEEIRAVHFRMHKAEGELFRDVLVRAAKARRLRLVEVPEKSLATSAAAQMKAIAGLGKSVGPPWGKDQKEAALAALLALQGRGR